MSVAIESILSYSGNTIAAPRVSVRCITPILNTDTTRSIVVISEGSFLIGMFQTRKPLSNTRKGFEQQVQF